MSGATDNRYFKCIASEIAYKVNILYEKNVFYMLLPLYALYVTVVDYMYLGEKCCVCTTKYEQVPISKSCHKIFRLVIFRYYI